MIIAKERPQELNQQICIETVKSTDTKHISKQRVRPTQRQIVRHAHQIDRYIGSWVSR